MVLLFVVYCIFYFHRIRIRIHCLMCHSASASSFRGAINLIGLLALA